MEGIVASEDSKDDDDKGDVVIELEAVAVGDEGYLQDDEHDEDNLGLGPFYQL